MTISGKPANMIILDDIDQESTDKQRAACRELFLSGFNNRVVWSETHSPDFWDVEQQETK